MKTNAIIRIVIFSFVILLLLGVLLTGIGVKLFMFDPQSNSEYTAGSVGNISADIRNLDIEWAAGAVEISTADVDTISFSEAVSGKTEEMHYKVEGDTLKILYGRSDLKLNLFSFANKDLFITVPRNWSASNLKIDAASAKLTITDFNANSAEIETASGETVFKNCNIGHLEVDTASGDVNYYGTLTELDCDGASADITAVLTNTPLSISLDSASGDLDLTLPSDSGFTARMDSMSGEFESEFETSYNGKYYRYGDGACEIEAECASGDIRIHKGQ